VKGCPSKICLSPSFLGTPFIHSFWTDERRWPRAIKDVAQKQIHHFSLFCIRQFKGFQGVIQLKGAKWGMNSRPQKDFGRMKWPPKINKKGMDTWPIFGCSLC
jgi:hypothetical protein